MEKYLSVSPSHGDKRYHRSIVVLPILIGAIVFSACAVAGGVCFRHPNLKAYVALAFAIFASVGLILPSMTFVKEALRKRNLYRPTRGREFILDADTVSVSIGLLKGPVEKVLMRKGAEYLKFKYSDVERWRISKPKVMSSVKYYEVTLRTLPDAFRILRDPITTANSEVELLKILDAMLMRPVKRK